MDQFYSYPTLRRTECRTRKKNWGKTQNMKTMSVRSDKIDKEDHTEIMLH